jgi:hypothetical protein
MSKLNSAMRGALKPSQFGVPGKRALPVNDEEHARKALQLGPRAVEHGTVTPGEFAATKAKVAREYPEIKSAGKRMMKRRSK